MRNLFLAASMALAAPMLIGANGNWNATVSETAGGHRLGNPEAKVKLTEWVSYTCSHCANFEQESQAPLKLFLVRSGTVAVEVRHFIRNPVDLTIAAITNCLPDSKFFATHSAFLLSHEKWMAKVHATNRAQQQRWTTGGVPARLRAVAGPNWIAVLPTRIEFAPSPPGRRPTSKNSRSRARQASPSTASWRMECMTGRPCERRWRMR